MDSVIIATRRFEEFERHFANVQTPTIQLVRTGEGAIEFWKIHRSRRLFCDVTALEDGYSGYRVAMRLRPEVKPSESMRLILLADAPDSVMNPRVLESLGVSGVMKPDPRDVADRIGVTLAARPVAPAPALPTANEADLLSSFPHLVGGVTQCNETLHRLIGPIAGKIIERAHPSEVLRVGDLRGYVDRVAAQIMLADVRQAFLEATRHIQI